MTRGGMNRGFRNRGGGRSFRGGGQFSNYKQRGNMRPPPPNFFSPGSFGYPQLNFNFPRGMNRFPARVPMPPNFRMRGGGGGSGGGMSHWHGSSSKKNQNKRNNKNLLSPASIKSRLMEKDVGITEYVSEHEGFNGIIKQRYSDFLVNEITPDGTIAKLTDLEPPVDVEHHRPESEIIEILSPEIVQKLKTMVETKLGFVEIEVTDKSKDDRRKIHEAIKDGFGKEVYSNTVDRGTKKFITIFKTRKGVMQDRRSRWPADRGGVYVHFVLYKRNMDTQETVNHLAGKLGVKPNFITYAGTKDRRALTSQMMSVFKIDPVKLAKLSNELKGVKLGNYSFKQTCLKLGDLKGNRFRISLRNVTGTDEQIEEAMNNLKEKGFINYYGLQRFGSSSAVPTPEVGRALLLGQWKEAIELILKPRNNDEPWALKRARKLWWVTKDARKAAKMLRSSFMNNIESKLLYGLSRHAPEDYVGALQNIPRNTRLLYLHSYQSLVWNKMVSRRIKEFGLKPMVGDLVFVDSEEFQEVVDQEGSVVQTDAFPKKPRKKAKKAAAAAAKAAAEKNGSNADDSSDKHPDSDSKSDGNATMKEDTSKPVDSDSSTKESANVGERKEDKEDGKNTDKSESATEENTGESTAEESQESSVESCPLFVDTHQKTPAVRAITEEDLDTVKIEDIVLPLPGHNVIYPNNVIKEWYEELLAVDGLTFSSMKQNVRQYSVSGTYRRMIVKPENLTWKTMKYSSPTSKLIQSDLDDLQKLPEPEDEPDGKFRALILDFCLPSSTYATMALREILKVDTSSIHQASLNNYATKEEEKDKVKEEPEEIKSDPSENIADNMEQEVSEAGGTKRKANDDDDDDDEDDDDDDDDEEEEDDDVAQAKKIKLEGET